MPRIGQYYVRIVEKDDKTAETNLSVWITKDLVAKAANADNQFIHKLSMMK